MRVLLLGCVSDGTAMARKQNLRSEGGHLIGQLPGRRDRSGRNETVRWDALAT